MSLTDSGRSVLNAKQKDIILVRFPFSDLAISKVRPALVVSNDNYNNRYLDRVVVALTSNLTVAEVKVVVNNSCSHDAPLELPVYHCCWFL